MFLDRRPSVSSQPRNGLHARWLFWGCKTHTSKEQAVIIEHCRWSHLGNSRAQSPSGSTSSPTSAQTQTNSPTNSTNAPSTQRAPSADSSTRSEPSNSAANQSAPSSPGSPSQAQTTPPAQSATPSQAQTNKPSPANSQAEQAPSSGTGNTNATAQQPNQPNQQSTAQSSSTNVNASVHINDQQRTRVTQSIDHLNVQPLTNVNFSLSVGTAVPRDVRLQTLPMSLKRFRSTADIAFSSCAMKS